MYCHTQIQSERFVFFYSHFYASLWENGLQFLLIMMQLQQKGNAYSNIAWVGISKGFFKMEEALWMRGKERKPSMLGCKNHH